MVQSFPRYDKRPIRDRQLVEPYGAIDLRVASSTGVLSGDAAGADAASNGIENPASILGKPDDVFTALRMQSYVKAGGAEAPKVTPLGSEPTA